MGVTHKIFCAGFGGQGVMSMGQLFSYAGLLAGKEVTWCPSYGPEMRGGEANCSVNISDELIGSPVIKHDATVAVLMNVAAFKKFEDQVKPGGSLYLNSSLIHEKPSRTDIKVYYVPVNDIAAEMGNTKLANMIMLGAVNKIEKIVDDELLLEAFTKVFGENKAKLIPINREAIKKGAASVE